MKFKDIILEEQEEIFIRLASKIEKNSPTAKRKAFNSFKEKNKYEIVYKPYGNKGAGFYYIKKEIK